MDINRGDIVACVVAGDYGKPRPAVVVQSDLFNTEHASVTICPITSHLIEAPLFRLMLVPSKSNGINVPSQIMVDKMVSLSREKIKQSIGHVSETVQLQLDRALRRWLHLQ